MIESKLTTLLMVGGRKVFPVIAPEQAKAPFLVYSRASTTRETDLDGPVSDEWATFRVDVYADSALAARQLANGVRRQLNGHSDDDIAYIELLQDRDLSDLSGSPLLYRVQLEFRVSHDDD